ncbi:hypothetical protein F0U59_03090 [Archangium gephyra]|nr:hypothetical protein F0U59_03090 [Archangium gephyra]
MARRIVGSVLVANAFLFLLELLVRQVRPLPITGIAYMMAELGGGDGLTAAARPLPGARARDACSNILC